MTRGGRDARDKLQNFVAVFRGRRGGFEIPVQVGLFEGIERDPLRREAVRFAEARPRAGREEAVVAGVAVITIEFGRLRKP